MVHLGLIQVLVDLDPWSMSGNGFTGSYNGTYSSLGGGNFFTGSIYKVTQSFELRSEKDIEVNVKTTVNDWSSSILPNYGFIVKLTGSQEFNPSEYIQPQFNNTIVLIQIQFTLHVKI
jgi:hypothetical protein